MSYEIIYAIGGIPQADDLRETAPSWKAAVALIAQWTDAHADGVTPSERGYFGGPMLPKPLLPGSRLRVVDGETGESIHVRRIR